MSSPRNRKGIVGSAVAVLSSLRLTVLLLSLCMILIFVATLLQVEMGIHEVQLKFFRSWIAWFDIVPGEKRFPIPFPGGMLLGALLLLNLLAAHICRFKLSWGKAGMLLVHTGIVLMLLGELFTAVLMELAATCISLAVAAASSVVMLRRPQPRSAIGTCAGFVDAVLGRLRSWRMMPAARWSISMQVASSRVRHTGAYRATGRILVL